MQAGKLRTTVTIQKVSSDTDSNGDVVTVYETIGTRKAKVSGLSGAESFSAKRVDSQVSHKVTMRYMNGLTTAHRLLIGTRALNISSIINLNERNKELEIMAVEDVTVTS